MSHHPPKGAKGAKKVYAFIDNLVAVARHQMGAAFPDVPAETIEQVATDIAHEMVFLYARTEMSIPAALPLTLGPRNAQIYADYGKDSATARAYTSDRIAELAAQHRLTTRQVQNILASGRAADAAARAADFASRQGSIFGSEAADTSSPGH